MKLSLLSLLVLELLTGASLARAEGQGDEVVVVYNSRMSESKDVAEHYAKMRHVPAKQVFGFPMPTREDISRTDFRETIEKPLARALANKGLWRFGSRSVPATNGHPEYLAQIVTQAKIRYAVLCYGVPLRSSQDAALKEEGIGQMRPDLGRNEAAVDSDLACLPIMDQHFVLAGPYMNPFRGCTNASLLNPTNGILLVARLDGPSPAIARALVDKAMQAETDGLWGRAYFDTRGLTNGAYKIGDDYIRGAAEIARRLGFETIIDENAGTFPVRYPMSQIAYYAGWYDEHASGPFTRPTVEFMPGAFAYHLHSFSAATLRSTDHQWVGPLLAKGATATMGCTAEPYLTGTPDIAIFTARFLASGFSFGEAAYASQNVLSWQITVVGDPLYRPFARSPRQLQDDLERTHSKLLEWSYLRLVNFKLILGMPPADVAVALENLELSRQSPVLQEKLADIYSQIGKPSSSVHALQAVLKLNPSPQQRVRVMLALAEHLIALGRDAEAYEVYRQFLTQCSDYPDLPAIYKHILDLAEKLGKKEDAAKYEELKNHPVQPPQRTPPLRPGI